MIDIELNPANGKLPLGVFLEIRWQSAVSGVETRLSLKHEGVRYLRPLRDWSTEPQMLIFPEAPGHYALVVQWRAPSGENGVHELPFDVITSDPSRMRPAKTRLGDGLSLWAPSQWEGHVLAEAERAVLAALRELIHPGDTVYDLGANLGVYTLHMARATGTDGRVYCIEANPICVQFLRTNLAQNRLRNIEILPIALSDAAGTIPFVLNYGNVNLGLTQASAFFGAKTGHEIQVPCDTLDHLAEEHRLRPPKVIKLDVEGAEIQAICGMQGLLERHQPSLVLELHGEGNARGVLEILDRLGYHYQAPGEPQILADGAAVLERYGDSVFQLMARPA